MKTTRPIFQDKVKLLYSEFDHYTPNGNAIYMYIFQRLQRYDTDTKTYKDYDSNNVVKMMGYTNVNATPGDLLEIIYTRKSATSWEFKLLSVSF